MTLFQVLGIAAVALFTAVFLFVSQGAWWAYVARKEREEREVVRRLGMLTDQQAEGGTLFRDRVQDASALALGRIGSHLQDTIEAGDSQMTVGTLLMQMGIAGLVVLLLAGFLLSPGAGLLFGFLAALVPYILVRRAATARSAKLVEQLPEALDLMARSLQAGLGLNEAFRTCAEEMPLPVASEFGRVFEEVRFGRDYREALTTLLRRNPGVFDLRLFVSSLLLQRDTGGNLIEILESISNTIRGRFLFKAKVAALTSEARFSALVLGSLPLLVAAMIFAQNRAYLQPLIDDWLGNIFLGMFFALYLSGSAMMWWISQVEV